MYICLFWNPSLIYLKINWWIKESYVKQKSTIADWRIYLGKFCVESTLGGNTSSLGLNLQLLLRTLHPLKLLCQLELLQLLLQESVLLLCLLFRLKVLKTDDTDLFRIWRTFKTKHHGHGALSSIRLIVKIIVCPTTEGISIIHAGTCPVTPFERDVDRKWKKNLYKSDFFSTKTLFAKTLHLVVYLHLFHWWSF